jgi:hypothetical protein
MYQIYNLISLLPGKKFSLFSEGRKSILGFKKGKIDAKQSLPGFSGNT